MAFSKTHLYDEESRIVSHFSRAMAHSARKIILEFLTREGPSTAGKLSKNHQISPEAISQHLKILREAGLIIVWEKFPYTFYKTHKPNVKKMKKYLNNFLDRL